MLGCPPFCPAARSSRRRATTARAPSPAPRPRSGAGRPCGRTRSSASSTTPSTRRPSARAWRTAPFARCATYSRSPSTPPERLILRRTRALGPLLPEQRCSAVSWPRLARRPKNVFASRSGSRPSSSEWRFRRGPPMVRARHLTPVCMSAWRIRSTYLIRTCRRFCIAFASRWPPPSPATGTTSSAGRRRPSVSWRSAAVKAWMTARMRGSKTAQSRGR
mmetsp:Transcript_104114/g.333859  ORF Transcript_104114/g.333859 Transcript_104114/m.333859 type:complete len:219 (+) Transcript_104114:628-1284(+)